MICNNRESVCGGFEVAASHSHDLPRVSFVSTPPHRLRGNEITYYNCQLTNIKMSNVEMINDKHVCVHCDGDGDCDLPSR